MITKDNLKEMLESLGFVSSLANAKRKDSSKGVYIKYYQGSNAIFIKVDFSKNEIVYSPIDESFKEGYFPSKEKQSTGIIIHRKTTLNLSDSENFVCLVCMDFLLSKGYEPKHIVIEPAFPLGHINKPSYGDILVYDKEYNNLVLIENKTYGSEFSKAWNLMLKNGGQLFSYLGTMGRCEYLCLFAADFDTNSHKMHYKSHLISLKDNEDYLKDLNANITNKQDKKKSFKEAKNTQEYYDVWNQSYGFSFTTKGLFEEDMQAYEVGKAKYTLSDLEQMPYAEIRTIYHDFATILRNNAIGNYENTFYILIDLFLCKIIDEKNMQKGKSDELKFYWKGFAYDNPLDYCDRLLKLYAQGKKELFEVDVVNISQGSIEQIFKRNKRHMGSLKDDLDRLFKEQKFYNIKKFNFIEVENKQEFELNFKILIQITALIQDIYISKSDNNQFLGDLFEGFLNRSIHQTEGRFFTPTPITNFIIHSLPPSKTNAKVLDFACGAGHFLTEFIQHNKNAQIFGIEKNKNLSMVAKIASVFHSNTDSKIIFQDALALVDKKKDYTKFFQNSSFDLILSNPPYSVKGFLEVLEENEREKFSLSKNIDSKSYDKNNAIECFFIERALHFLKEGGLFALVLPISILQKGGIYEKTRELLLKHFTILSFVSLNSRTFGSTGTQTVILFAKKIHKIGQDALNFLKTHNFDCKAFLQEYNTHNFLESYAKFMGYELEDFKDFLQNLCLSESLRQTPSFVNYFNDYESTSTKKKFKKRKISESETKRLFENSSFFAKQSPNSKEYKKAFNDFKKSDEFLKKLQSWHFQRFLQEVREVELDKLLYFSYIEPNTCLIIKSPEDKNKEGKSNKAKIVSFLGYDWSRRKGDEGIKYQTQIEDTELKEQESDSDEDKKDKEALRNINSIKFINTPLYNPKNPNDTTKLNYAIKAFISNQCDEELIRALRSDDVDSYSIFTSPLLHLIDFEKAEFNKAISLNPIRTFATSSLRGEAIHQSHNPFANCKYELVRLGEIILENPKSKIKVRDAKENTTGTYPFYTSGVNVYKYDEALIDGENIYLSTGGNAIVQFYSGKSAYSTDTYAIKSRDSNQIMTKFIFYILESKVNYINMFLFEGMGLKHLQKTALKNLKIPLPPIEIQKQIVEKCEKVEKQSSTIKTSIEKYQELIKAILAKCAITESSTDNASIQEILTQLNTLESSLDFDLLFECLESTNADSKDISGVVLNMAGFSHSKGGQRTIEESKNIDSSNTESKAESTLLKPLNLKALLDSLPTPPPQGWERVNLNDKKTFELQIGKRVLDSELIENGTIPVYSANVKKPFGYINKELLGNYTSDSVLWGIDGDWMVGFMPSGKAFYPTDHCGVLRVKTENIQAKILAFGLENEGRKVGFRREYRASLERVRNLQIPLPPIESQKQIINAISKIEEKISLMDSSLEGLEGKKSKILKSALEST